MNINYYAKSYQELSHMVVVCIIVTINKVSGFVGVALFSSNYNIEIFEKYLK